MNSNSETLVDAAVEKPVATALVQPVPFEITNNDHGGKTATNGQTALVLLDGDGKMFRRRAVVGFSRMVEWAVCELDGVRVYFDGTQCVVTRKDIYPR